MFGRTNSNNEQTEGDCWGGLMGAAGARMNKTGSMSWHQKINADGKGGVANSSGQWND